MNYDASQRAAIEAACDPDTRDIIVTGGAGVGKTTVIRAISEKLGNVEIMAPTGKAAARLKEATGCYAETIHRALQWDGERINRVVPFNRPVIVDESSMMDTWLLSTMLSFNPPKLILVGDPAQLAPVGKGQPFHDLVALRTDMVQELTHCWRAQGAVHKAGQMVRRGEAPLTTDVSGGETFRMVETGTAEATEDKLIKWVKAGYFDPAQDVILSPRYGEGDRDGGIDAINEAVRNIVNPSLDKFSNGDRIIINKNFSKDDLWNGDLGFVSDEDVSGDLWVTLDRDPGSPRLLEAEHRREMSHAYCLSVHKSQGSQFRHVYFVCLKTHWYQLSRSLIYTAITRAQKGVCVIGQLSAFYHGINIVNSKRTCIQWMANSGRKV
jgi:exodeoxyribonuclease V alpha subunit